MRKVSNGVGKPIPYLPLSENKTKIQDVQELRYSSRSSIVINIVKRLNKFLFISLAPCGRKQYAEMPINRWLGIVCHDLTRPASWVHATAALASNRSALVRSICRPEAVMR